jgi:hypothetical protein
VILLFCVLELVPYMRNFVQSLGRNLETFSVMHKCKSTVVQNSYDLQGGWGLAALALASYIGPFDIRCGGGGGGGS